VLWESIRWAGEQGYKTFEIVGADDYSLFPFKRKFNGKVISYYQMKWLSPSVNLVSSLYHSLKKGDNNQLGI
jgi:lipid II:glycine glycyltransferase (peptidoglycan interpeptide bridge formation enzyme)